MAVSTRNTPSPDFGAACLPFSGLGHATEAVEAAAECMRPRRETASAGVRPVQRYAGPSGYALQCRLGRETRAG